MSRCAQIRLNFPLYRIRVCDIFKKLIHIPLPGSSFTLKKIIKNKNIALNFFFLYNTVTKIIKN